MIYKFTSKAAGDLLMSDEVGARMLRIIGKDVAARGIIEVAAMPAALDALAAAVAEDKSARAQVTHEPSARSPEPADVDSVTLRQHAWPLVEMLKRAQAAAEAVVWGV